jgi:hypothetical protein
MIASAMMYSGAAITDVTTATISRGISEAPEIHAPTTNANAARTERIASVLAMRERRSDHADLYFTISRSSENGVFVVIAVFSFVLC